MLPNPKKTEAIANIKSPTNVTQVQSFLGLASYYRKFVESFATIASPITRLTEKNTSFKWSYECQAAFEELKRRLISEPILTLPDFGQEFTIATDASGVGIGAVLTQKRNGEDKPIAFYSKHLSKVERRYSTSERELLAKSSRRTITNSRSTSERTDEDDVIINEIHLKQDTLNKEQLKDKNLNFIFGLKRLEREGKPKPLIKEFINDEQRNLYHQWKRIMIINNNLFREVVSKDRDEITYQYIVPQHQVEYVLNLCHDSKCSAHLGFEKTRDRITARFYWPNQLNDISNYVKRCVSCQQKKDPKHINRAELTPLRPTRPLELITTDIMGPLPITKKRNRYILVVVDHFTKYVEIFALKTLEASEVADKLVEFICRHSVPDAILSDQISPDKSRHNHK